jgi:hypothetical protein
MVGLSSLHAQDINRDRMQRDINIMESVLEEMFKSEWSTEDGAGKLTGVTMHGKGLIWATNENNTVEGSYFTEYGALFMITGSKPVIVNLGNNKNATGYFNSAVGTTNSRVEINRESIVNRISEFLMDYASNIKQLEPNDKVSVVYKANNVDQLLTISINDSLDKVDTKSVPSVFASATVRDLQAYRKGQIDESSFTDRLRINDIDPKDESERKLRIMSKILQTTFDDDQSDNFKISDVSHTYLEGFGAIFKSKASYGSGFFGLNIAFSKIRDRLKKMTETDSSMSASISGDNTSWSSDDDTNNKTREEIETAYDTFVSILKETVVDYGQTLSSVQSDENILISLSVSAAGNSVPERVNLQVKKSVLQSIDSGQMSRKQAMEQITVREY